MLRTATTIIATTTIIMMMMNMWNKLYTT